MGGSISGNWIFPWRDTPCELSVGKRSKTRQVADLDGVLITDHSPEVSSLTAEGTPLH